MNTARAPISRRQFLGTTLAGSAVLAMATPQEDKKCSHEGHVMYKDLEESPKP